MRTYGILSGHGGAVTSRFHQLLTELVLTHTNGNDEDYPNTITTNLTGYAINNAGHIDQAQLAALLDRTMPVFATSTDLILLCNSFYSHETLFAERYNGNLIHLPELVLQNIPQKKSTLVVASSTVHQHHLYGNDVHYAKDVEGIIEAGIRMQNAEELIRDLHRRYPHAEHVVLGCTDLSVLEDQFREIFRTPVTDSVRTAATHVMETTHNTNPLLEVAT